VADAMDAMLAKRSYQPSRRLKDVRTELLRCRSSQFDPQIVDVAVTWIDECVRAADRSRPAKPA
jgi:HD-GYP domain-containing protein (c-di-GMP phosphodiesterase class II)